MPVRKTEYADLRGRYGLTVEFSLAIALGLLILAFRIDWNPQDGFEIAALEPEQITIEEIQQTEQIETPPPPPRPPVPVEVPDDYVLDDEALDLDAFLDLDAPLAPLPPPPPPAEEAEEDAEPEIFVVVEQMPEPIGGMEAIYRRAANYPEMARRAGIEGRVTVQFVVDEEGIVRDAEVLHGPGAGLNELALEAIVNTRFTPGRQRGTPVRVRMAIPITFRLR